MPQPYTVTQLPPVLRDLVPSGGEDTVLQVVTRSGKTRDVAEVTYDFQTRTVTIRTA